MVGRNGSAEFGEYEAHRYGGILVPLAYFGISNICLAEVGLKRISASEESRRECTCAFLRVFA